jgi:hypothetical protein
VAARLAVAAAVLAALAVEAPAAPAAKRAPALRLASPLVLAPRTVVPGGTVRVVDAVRNRGRRRSTAARTRFALVRDGAAEVPLGRRRVPPLRPGAASRRTVTLTVPLSAAPGVWSVVACVRARRCRTALLPLRIAVPPQPAPQRPPPPLEERVVGPLPEPAPDPPPLPTPFTGLARVQDCGPAIPADDAPASAFTDMFAATTTGWTGADATYSVVLPDGRTSWWFGDTFLGGLNGSGGRTDPYPYIHNSVVVQDQCLTTLFRGSLEAPLDFEPRDDGDWYWINQPVVHGVTVRAFLTRITGTGTNYAAAGSALGTYDLALNRITVDEDVPTLPGQWWGAALVDEAPYTYVFGIRLAGGTRDVLLARVPHQLLDAPWEYRTATGWSLNLADAAPVLSDPERLATQISVLRDGEDWVLVSQDAFPRTDVNVWRGPDPWAWGARQTLTTLPDVPGAAVYNALVHPQFTDGEQLLLSYNVIAGPAETMADASLYRPRFVRVALP